MHSSDGAGSQYKNRKKFINLCLHQENFRVSAEWHFYATSHGKGACDGLGGTLKRLAARASLQQPYNDQIMTPRQLYNWAKVSIQNIHFNAPALKTTKRNQKNFINVFYHLRLFLELVNTTRLYQSQKIKLKHLFTPVLFHRMKRCLQWLTMACHLSQFEVLSHVHQMESGG